MAIPSILTQLGPTRGFSNPQGIAIYSAGNFYVSGDQDSTGNRIKKNYTCRRREHFGWPVTTRTATVAQCAICIAQWPGGGCVRTVYVADEHSIRKISPDGTVSTWVGDQGKPTSKIATASASMRNLMARRKSHWIARVDFTWLIQLVRQLDTYQPQARSAR